jgi:hypothetical protein
MNNFDLSKLTREVETLTINFLLTWVVVRKEEVE